MAKFEIYKRGQGVYVRFGTVAALGLVLVVGLGWLFSLLGGFQPAMPVASTQTGQPAFNWAANWLFVQSGVVLLVGLLGALGIFMLCNNPKFAEFQIMTESEMKKVTWPTRKSVVRSTQVIIFMTFLFAGILWGVDLGFLWLFEAIGLIPKGSS